MLRMAVYLNSIEQHEYIIMSTKTESMGEYKFENGEIVEVLQITNLVSTKKFTGLSGYAEGSKKYITSSGIDLNGCDEGFKTLDQELLVKA